MPETYKNIPPKLITYFTSDSFAVDFEESCFRQYDKNDGSFHEFREWKQRFEDNKIKALYELGFQSKKEWFTPQLDYLYHITDMLIQKLTKQPDIELSRDLVQVELTDEERNRLKDELPYAIGMEHGGRLNKI